MQQEWHALCIVNTRKRAQRLYEQLQGEGVYHCLPLCIRCIGNGCLRRLENVWMTKRKKCIVISTSLVEAGVDLDFTSVYRELAGVDSIIQAAGRCNRMIKRKGREHCPHLPVGRQGKGIPTAAADRHDEKSAGGGQRYYCTG